MFPADGGGHLQPSTLCRYWYEARAQAGRKDLRWHDLRHSGAVLAAATGASLAELMQRLGHSTPQAAMRYQHVASGRPAEVAALLSKLAEGGQTPTHCCQHRQKANCPNGIATLGEFADTPNYCPKTLVGTSPWDTKRSVRTVPMDAPDMSIADAADYLGVTERTVRKGDFRLNRTVLRTFETIVINPEPLMQQFIDLR